MPYWTRSRAAGVRLMHPMSHTTEHGISFYESYCSAEWCITRWHHIGTGSNRVRQKKHYCLGLFECFLTARSSKSDVIDDVCNTIWHERLSQARHLSAPALPDIVITFKRLLPPRLTYCVQSEPDVIRIPQPNPNFCDWAFWPGPHFCSDHSHFCQVTRWYFCSDNRHQTQLPHLLLRVLQRQMLLHRYPRQGHRHLPVLRDFRSACILPLAPTALPPSSSAPAFARITFAVSTTHHYLYIGHGVVFPCRISLFLGVQCIYSPRWSLCSNFSRSSICFFIFPRYCLLWSPAVRRIISFPDAPASSSSSFTSSPAQSLYRSSHSLVIAKQTLPSLHHVHAHTSSSSPVVANRLVISMPPLCNVISCCLTRTSSSAHVQAILQ